MALQVRGVRTRQQLLRAAACVFVELGYENASIAKIIKRAGVTHGALYFHFPSKEELARGVLQEAVTTEGVVPQDLKLQEWIDTALALAYRLPEEPVQEAALRLAVDPSARILFGSRWADWMGLLTQLLQEAQQRGEVFPHVDPKESARVMMSAWTGMQLVLDDVPSGFDLEYHIASMLNHILPAIAVPAVLARLDTARGRGARIVAEARAMSASVDGEEAPGVLS